MDIISSISTEVVDYESDDYNDDIAIIDNKTVFVKRYRAPKEAPMEMSQIIKKMRVTTSEYLVKDDIEDVVAKKNSFDSIPSIFTDHFYHDADANDEDVVVIDKTPNSRSESHVELKTAKKQQKYNLVQTVMSLSQFGTFSGFVLSPPSIDQIDRCKPYWRKASQFSTVVVKRFKVGFSGGEVDLLERHVYRHQPRMMLWDESICICMKLYQRLDDNFCSKSITRKPSHFFESQFFNLIYVQERLYKHSDITKCFDNITKPSHCSIFDMDKLFFPINIENYHWILIVVHIQAKTIQCYDSNFDIDDDRSSRMKSLVIMLRHEALRQGICDAVEWKIIPTNPKLLLQQKNSSDCGVFTCIYALYLILGLPFSFTLNNIKSMRILMVLWFLDA